MGKPDIIFEIVDIKWERVFLDISINSNYDGNPEFYLERIVGTSVKERVPVRHQKTVEGYRLYWNITAAKRRQFLNNGRWRVTAAGKYSRYFCCISRKEAYRLDEASRIFRYGGDTYAYNISFGAELEEDRYLRFYIYSYFMIQNKDWKRRRYVQEVSGIKAKLKRIPVSVMVPLVQTGYDILSHIYPKNGKNILLMSETRDTLWGNLKAIDERIRARGLDRRFKVHYSFRKAAGGEQSLFSWIRLIMNLAKQDYVFVDDYVPVFGFLNLNKKTKLIQVWHAGVGFKSVGYSRFGKSGTPHATASCHKKYDYALVASESLAEVYEEVFGIEKEAFLPVGMPRLDGFLDKDRIGAKKKEFYDMYPMLEGKKIILFAPTYRGEGQKNAYYEYDWLDLERIYDYCGEETVFLIKMHPFVKKSIQIPKEYQNRIMDFASYPDINNLYYVTDILITDYSSNYFEYSLMKRPLLFYTPDRELYEISRGVHRSIKESAPGKVCDTFEELMTALEQNDYEFEKTLMFAENISSNLDHHAADRVIDQVLGIGPGSDTEEDSEKKRNERNKRR